MNESYGDQIKSYRINLGLTQGEVANELNVTPATSVMWKTGGQLCP